MKPDNMWMFYALKHLQLVIHHLFIAFHVLLEYDLDGHLLTIDFCFSNDAIRASAERSTEFVLRFLIVAVWLAVQLVEHTLNCDVDVSFTSSCRIQHQRHNDAVIGFGMDIDSPERFVQSLHLRRLFGRLE